jgi:hypothetical protein
LGSGAKRAGRDDMVNIPNPTFFLSTKSPGYVVLGLYVIGVKKYFLCQVVFNQFAEIKKSC